MPDDAKDYDHAIEGVNLELVNALRQCIKLLEQFTDSVTDIVGW